MKDPFSPDLLSAIGRAVLPVLLDRVGGSIVFSQVDFDAVANKYGGALEVRANRAGPGMFQITLAPSTRERPPAGPVS